MTDTLPSLARLKALVKEADYWMAVFKEHIILRKCVTAMRAIIATMEGHGNDGLAFMSASEAACYKWPDDTAEHRATRAAYCEGAASMSDALDLAHAEAAALREALEQAAAWFSEYQRIHLGKFDEDKAHRNGERARACEAALSTTAGRDMLERLRKAEAEVARLTAIQVGIATTSQQQALERAEAAEARLAAAEAAARRKDDALRKARHALTANTIEYRSHRALREAVEAIDGVLKEPTDGQ